MNREEKFHLFFYRLIHAYFNIVIFTSVLFVYVQIYEIYVTNDIYAYMLILILVYSLCILKYKYLYCIIYASLILSY